MSLGKLLNHTEIAETIAQQMSTEGVRNILKANVEKTEEFLKKHLGLSELDLWQYQGRTDKKPFEDLYVDQTTEGNYRIANINIYMASNRILITNNYVTCRFDPFAF